MCQRLMNMRSSCSLSLSRRQMQQALQAWGLQREGLGFVSASTPGEGSGRRLRCATFSGLSLGLSISSYPSELAATTKLYDLLIWS